MVKEYMYGECNGQAFLPYVNTICSMNISVQKSRISESDTVIYVQSILNAVSDMEQDISYEKRCLGQLNKHIRINEKNEAIMPVGGQIKKVVILIKISYLYLFVIM